MFCVMFLERYKKSFNRVTSLVPVIHFLWALLIVHVNILMILFSFISLLKYEFSFKFVFVITKVPVYVSLFYKPVKV
jgi:hypothetical protein